MKTYHITKQNFLDWYFNSGSNDEIQSMRESLAEKALKQLLKTSTATITAEMLFSDCTIELIPLTYLEDFEGVVLDLTIEDLKEEIEVKLID